MKIAKEYGGWVTEILGFAFTLIYSLIFNSNLIFIIFWIPTFIGLLMFDFKPGEIDKVSMILIISGVIFSLISISIYLFIIIPYLFFFLSFFSRYKKFNNYIVTFFGLMGEVMMIFFSLKFNGIDFLEYSIFLLIYLYGAEFAVKSFIKKNIVFSFYNLIPIIISVISIPVFIIAITRFYYFRIKKIKIIGMMESISYAIIISYFIIIALIHR